MFKNISRFIAFSIFFSSSASLLLATPDSHPASKPERPINILGFQTGQTYKEILVHLKALKATIQSDKTRKSRGPNGQIEMSRRVSVGFAKGAPFSRASFYFLRDYLFRYKINGKGLSVAAAHKRKPPAFQKNGYHFWFYPNKLQAMRCKSSRCEVLGFHVFRILGMKEVQIQALFTRLQKSSSVTRRGNSRQKQLQQLLERLKKQRKASKKLSTQIKNQKATSQPTSKPSIQIIPSTK